MSFALAHIELDFSLSSLPQSHTFTLRTYCPLGRTTQT